MTDSPAQPAVGLGVDPAVDRVRDVIDQRLRAVERERNLRVIFACESGSRAWGFASNDSDFDVRFIYVRPAADYLKLRPPVDAFDQQGEDDFDLSARLASLRAEYFDPKKTVYHYLSLAGGVWKKYLADVAKPVRKKYLYTLRPLACVKYIAQHQHMPPTLFEAVLDQIDLPTETRGAIDSLVADKKANRELGAGPADTTLNTWVTQVLEEGEAIAASLPTSGADNTSLDQLIADAILAPKGSS